MALEILRPAPNSQSLQDELTIGRMRHALVGLTPAQLDDEIECLFAFADARIADDNVLRFAAAARQTEKIRRRCMTERACFSNVGGAA